MKLPEILFADSGACLTGGGPSGLQLPLPGVGAGEGNGQMRKEVVATGQSQGTTRKLSLKHPMPPLRPQSLTLTCCLVTCVFILNCNIEESSCYFGVLISWVSSSQVFPIIPIIKFPFEWQLRGNRLSDVCKSVKLNTLPRKARMTEKMMG